VPPPPDAPKDVTFAEYWERVTCKLVLPHIRVDDWVFGVSAVSADGFESPVASAVPGGAFKPYVAPPPAKPSS
jgi:hypothetical protein